jgi:hypothetical protein
MGVAYSTHVFQSKHLKERDELEQVDDRRTRLQFCVSVVTVTSADSFVTPFLFVFVTERHSR